MAAMEISTQLTYGGTNCILFRKGGSTLLIDPHFTRPAFLSLLGKIKPSPEKIRGRPGAVGHPKRGRGPADAYPL